MVNMFKILNPIIALLCSSVMASAVTVNVDGQSSVYGPGLTPSGSSNAAYSHMFSPIAGSFLRFSSVTGSVKLRPSSSGFGGDGGDNGFSNGETIANGTRGFSGITAPTQGFLAGIFIDSSTFPGGTADTFYTGSGGAGIFQSLPDVLDFQTLGVDFSSLAPKLRQAFFIGDGLTGTGSGDLQKFFIPDQADVLLLGFVDFNPITFSPSLYQNNLGSFDVTFEITAVPVPGGLPLMAAGFIVLGTVRLRQRKIA